MKVLDFLTSLIKTFNLAIYDSSPDNDNLFFLDYMSCEMIAEQLIGYISNTYPGRYIEASVSEDGENGAVLKYHPHEDITI